MPRVADCSQPRGLFSRLREPPAAELRRGCIASIAVLRRSSFPRGATRRYTTDAPDKHGPPAIASEDIVTRRLSVVAVHRTARFAPVTESTWLAYLRDALSNELGQRGIDVLKIGYLLVGETELSQCVAGLVYDHFPHAAGITSPSTMGTDFDNFAVLEGHSERGDLRAEIRVVSTKQLNVGMSELVVALERLGLSRSASRCQLPSRGVAASGRRRMRCGVPVARPVVRKSGPVRVAGDARRREVFVEIRFELGNAGRCAPRTPAASLTTASASGLANGSRRPSSSPR
jgi:hypothetical protein